MIREEKVLRERLRVEDDSMEKYVEVKRHYTVLLDTCNHGLGFLVLYLITYIV